MPSSPPGDVSSPLRNTGVRRSRFTYRQLFQLASYSTSSPLRVIAHIDLDAFYAQCEMIRLGIPEDKPLAVQQWQGLIAVNYPARDAGISRHCDVAEAKKLCPELIAQHVATWREGDAKWAYRDDAAVNIAKDKVSLDPYRLQSRKILALVKEVLPANLQKVEKASIDEVFLDLSAHVHSILLDRYPELSNPPPYDDPTERLPLPSTAALDWQADALVDLEEEQEAVDPDWDDVAILIGSEVVREVRARIRERLGYTSSAGIASNKLLSKLGSACKKPNAQTVIRNRAVSTFLGDFKITKMRNLGGKLGEQVVSTFNTDSVMELLDVSLEQMKQRIADETGLWLYNTIRGIDTSDVNPRTQIKSMLSAKSFRPAIGTFEQGVKWLRIFVADVFTRLIEEGVLENKRRPRTINLHHRHSRQTHSRQAPIPQGRAINEEVLFQLAKELLSQIVAGGMVWPCENLSLSVGGFEEGVKGNMGIDAFLVKGEEAQSLRSVTPDSRSDFTGSEQPVKKRRVEGAGIHRFFSARSSSTGTTSDEQGIEAVECRHNVRSPARDSEGNNEHGSSERSREMPDYKTQISITSFLCARCKVNFDDTKELQSHEDWHMAKDLQDEERVRTTFAEPPSVSRNPNLKGSSASSKRGRGAKREPGQSRLNFG